MGAIRADDDQAGDSPVDGILAAAPDHRRQVDEHSAAWCAAGDPVRQPKADVQDDLARLPEDDRDDLPRVAGPGRAAVLPKVWSMVGVTAPAAWRRKKAARRGGRLVWKEMGG